MGISGLDSIIHQMIQSDLLKGHGLNHEAAQVFATPNLKDAGSIVFFPKGMRKQKYQIWKELPVVPNLNILVGYLYKKLW